MKNEVYGNLNLAISMPIRSKNENMAVLEASYHASETCQKEFLVNESKVKNNKWHFCSRECYSKFRSDNLTGENVYNYQRLILFLFLPTLLLVDMV